MKHRIPALAVAAQCAVFVCAAHDGDRLLAQAKIVGVRGAVMANPVKGAPYSGTEITESTRFLADGTRIHNERQAAVYRDSEGRTRRETPDEVTIFDPVAKVSYLLRPKDQTARKLPFATGGMVAAMGEGKRIFHYEINTANRSTITDEKLRAELEQLPPLIVPPPPGSAESLGKQEIEGLAVEGTRVKSVIETGAIGNDRPIEIVSERWFSPDLQTVIRTRHSDPRTGEEAFRLTGITRSEPAAYLFQVPPDYRLLQ